MTVTPKSADCIACADRRDRGSRPHGPRRLRRALRRRLRGVAVDRARGVGEPSVRQRRRAARGDGLGRRALAARRAARADPRPSGPGRQGGDRRAVAGVDARAGRRRARPPDARAVRAHHDAHRRLPRALRLPVRRLRARAHAGLDHRHRRCPPGGPPRRGGADRLVRDRQDRPTAARRPGRMTRIGYGKLAVPVQLVGVAPLHGLPSIPESPVRALESGLLALDVSMEVLGQGFLAAYTEGDNRNVVATDTMKNVILRHALEYDGATPERFLDTLGQRFLSAYPEMEGLRLWAREQPFAPVPIGAGAERSDRLFSLGGGDHAVAELELARDGLVAARSGQVGLRLLKTTGSAFTKFARDDATTLPERADRPLFVHLDVHWRYADA